ncbi:MAG: hypothetical protein ACLT8C_00720 [Akkermansia muciniphila]
MAETLTSRFTLISSTTNARRAMEEYIKGAEWKRWTTSARSTSSR